jgi:hypothetical protein
MIFVFGSGAVIEREAFFFFLSPGDKLINQQQQQQHLVRSHILLFPFYQTFPALTFQSYRDQL